MSKSEDCLFCKIIDGRIPSEKVYEDDTTYAFKDINPKAKVHVLIVPKDHYANVAELAAADPAELAHIVGLAQGIADKEFSGAYRLVFACRPRRQADRRSIARMCSRQTRQVGDSDNDDPRITLPVTA